MPEPKLKLRPKEIQALKQLKPDQAITLVTAIQEVNSLGMLFEAEVRRLREDTGVKSYDFRDYSGINRNALIASVLLGCQYVSRLDLAYEALANTFLFKKDQGALSFFHKRRCQKALRTIYEFLQALEVMQYGNHNVEFIDRGMELINEGMTPIMAAVQYEEYL